MKLLSRAIELLLISSFVFLASGCPKGNYKKTVPVVLPVEKKVLSDELGFDYSTLQEAASKIIPRLETESDTPDLRPMDALVTLLEHDPATLDYDFKAMVDSGYLHITTSDDGNLRYYYWDTGMGDAMPDWENVIQFRDGGEPYAYRGSILDFVTPGQDDAGPGCAVSKIVTAPTIKNGTYYLVNAYAGEATNLEYAMVVPVQIADGQIVSLNVFPGEANAGADRNVTWREYDPWNWYERTDGAGFKWIYNYDATARTLYVPVVVDNSITDRYNLYTLENGMYVYGGEDGGFWLHPTLRHFKNLEVMFATPQFMVRIDRLDDGSYRYASWSDELSMVGQPDIVLFNGNYDPAENTYSFFNGSFEYRIHPGAEVDELTVFEGDKKILSENRVDRFER